VQEEFQSATSIVELNKVIIAKKLVIECLFDAVLETGRTS